MTTTRGTFWDNHISTTFTITQEINANTNSSGLEKYIVELSQDHWKTQTKALVYAKDGGC